MMALARVAFALAASLAGAADVVTYDNATKEVATMEAFYDAVLAAGRPALLGGLALVNGSLDAALATGGAPCLRAGPACASLLDVLVVPRYVAHDYVARAAGALVARANDAAPAAAARVGALVAPKVVAARDAGCRAPAHSFYAVLRGAAAASGDGWTAAANDERNGLFVPGGAGAFAVTPTAGALVLRFCTLDAANFAAARKDLVRDAAASRPFPDESGPREHELVQQLDDPAFDTRMDFHGEDLPWAAFASFPRPEKPPARGKRNFGLWQADQRWRWRVVGATIPELAPPKVVAVGRETCALAVASGYARKPGDDAKFGFDVAYEATGEPVAAALELATHGSGNASGVQFFDADAHAAEEREPGRETSARFPRLLSRSVATRFG